MDKIWNQWMEQFGPEVIGKAIAEFVPQLFGAVIIVVFFWLLWRVTSRW